MFTFPSEERFAFLICSKSDPTAESEVVQSVLSEAQTAGRQGRANRNSPSKAQREKEFLSFFLVFIVFMSTAPPTTVNRSVCVPFKVTVQENWGTVAATSPVWSLTQNVHSSLKQKRKKSVCSLVLGVQTFGMRARFGVGKIFEAQPLGLTF